MPSSSRPPLRRKIRPLRALVAAARRAQARGRRVVFTNGCFDLIHRGHVQLLDQASRLGDVLVVGINSDRSCRKLKGRSRPIVNQQDRAVVLAGLASVDFVTVFDAPTPKHLIERLRPDVLVKGADWQGSEIVGADTVRRAGGKIVRVRLARGRSTTGLIERIRRSG
jgi:rfaE bifunctional protein nucleotidyltransferase chain/domain